MKIKIFDDDNKAIFKSKGKIKKVLEELDEFVYNKIK